MPDPHNSASPTHVASAEDPIDRALAALRQAEVPSGLEQRVLRNLAVRRAERPERTRFWPRLLAPRLPWFPATLAATGLLTVTLSVAVLHRRHAPAVALAPHPAALPSAVAVPFKTAQVSLQRHSVDTPAKPARSPETMISAHAPSPVTPPDSQEQDHPAPELPLTPQERLLVRMAYGPQPQQQMAMLHRTGIRLHPSADDDFDFNAFFEPHTTPLTEGDPQ